MKKEKRVCRELIFAGTIFFIVYRKSSRRKTITQQDTDT